MTAEERDDLIETIKDLPDDMTLEEFGEDLILSAFATKAMARPSSGDMTTDQLLNEIKTWN